MPGSVARIFLLLLLALGVPGKAAAEPPDAALARLLAEARSEAGATGTCARGDIDRLVRIFCSGRIRAGVREYYPLFGTRTGTERSGYDVDGARAIADFLDLDLELVRVNASTRIAMLDEDKIDIVLATMGHNTQRDGQARFIRPHYYQSETIIVGPKELPVSGWKDVAGRSICVSLGNGSNAQMISHHARLMLFTDVTELPARLVDETCMLAAQDNSFFASYFTDEAFDRRFETKFGFAQVPWGIGVARSGSERLARALDLMSQIFHRDGRFLEIGRNNKIATGFLLRQREVWNRPECNTAVGSTDPACILPPLDAGLEPTPFAGHAVAFEQWIAEKTGVALSLPMLKTMPAWTLFQRGIFNSLYLVIGALAATLVFALLLGALQSGRSRIVYWVFHSLTVILQSSPVVLLVVIAAAVAQEVFAYSSVVAIGAAIVALGLMNGSNAGQAIAEAMHTLHAENAGKTVPETKLFGRAVSRSATQIVSFLINAAKGTPVASFIGAPELLSALTDITSFASGRATTYTILLVFYVIVVMIVVWLCGRLRVVLERRHA
ncbi:transporter substrate-binding domain-containing protein [Nisaea sp.]|uniref:transporter substrate-binding domain-containing protein n=1 Tax=Nisaea sp. TaxID=2024842 RepID=UPI003B52EB32